VREVQKLDQIDSISTKLDTAEAFNVAYVGSKADKQKRNQKQLSNWRTKQINQINKLLKRARQTIWETKGKKARRL
jgi:hypothetical protein